MAHRGNPAHSPENTLASFRQALELEVDIMEFDVRSSLDGHLVVIHDPMVDRTTDGKGSVKSKTLAELKSLDAGNWKDAAFAGERIPTLMETLELFASHKNLILNVEIKDHEEETTRAAVALCREQGLFDRCVFTSFDAEILAWLASPEVGGKTQGFPRNRMGRTRKDVFPSMDFVGIPVAAACSELFDWYAGRGVVPGVWCVDDAPTALSMAEQGACIITSNDPKIVIQALVAGGYR